MDSRANMNKKKEIFLYLYCITVDLTLNAYQISYPEYLRPFTLGHPLGRSRSTNTKNSRLS